VSGSSSSSGAAGGSQRGLTLLKLGGELLEPGPGLAPLVDAIQQLVATGPLVIVHGAGREIDAETQRRGVPKQAVDGLRITDAPTLDAVIAVLAGTVNTRLVAALVGAGTRAVGLTGVDAAIGLSERAPAHRAVDGRLVDLGLVGQPVARAGGVGASGVQKPALLADLISHGYVPVIACLGVEASGQVLNVNADTLAAALAASCGAQRLIFAGATAGVLETDQSTIATLDEAGIDRMIGDGSASAGMIAKLRACRDALRGGVQDVAIVSGRHGGFLTAPGTRIVTRAEAVHPSA
jgi:acetylglutamate kinase